MQIMQNSGREQHLRLRILNILNGQTASGMENRKKEEDVYAQPMAIYEVHPGSWKRHPGRMMKDFTVTGIS